MKLGTESGMKSYSILLVMICSAMIGCNSTRYAKRDDSVKDGGSCTSKECTDRDCRGACTSRESRSSNLFGSKRKTEDCGASAGCKSDGSCGTDCQQCSYSVPRELKKVSLPSYTVEPPDILLIEVTNSIRPDNAKLRVGESLGIQAANTIPIDALDSPIARNFKTIDGIFRIQTDGRVNLGPEYGSVIVKNLSLADAQRAIRGHLRNTLRNAQVHIQLASDQARQHISGEHLVRPDGTVALGVYGSVYVSGSTLTETRQRIQRHLAESQELHDPEVTVDVLAYNSKVYYVVTDGAGAGEQVFRFPCTGNETVLDAVAQINGLPAVASKKHIWIARPAHPSLGHEQILQVDWNSIVQGGQTRTNFQVLPGDRVYVRADELVTFDTALAKLTAPIERVLGFVLLGNGTLRALQFGHRGQNGGSF
jgi:polysaccharide biosynthesis/export protein